MQYINGIYYFLIHEHDGTWNSDTRYRYSRFDPKNPDSTDYCFGIFRGKGSLGGSTEIIPSDSGTLCLGNDSALSFHESNGVRRFNFEAEKIEYIIGKGASTYLLIGEYLYKQMYSGEWQKTNISNGWDNLQWEILQFPD